MNIFDLLTLECIEVEVEVADKTQALRKIVEVAKKHPVLENIDKNTLFSALATRESLNSSALGDGIAIPHCHLQDLDQFVIGMLTVPKGVDFCALDEKDTYLFLFIIAPENNKNYVKLLSLISYTLNIPGVVQELVGAKTAEIAYESFLMHVRDDEEPEGNIHCDLIHVVIQEESYFRNILNIFSTMTSCSVTVIESHSLQKYLRELPLFTDLWSDQHPFNRMIIAVVNRKLTNDVIRKIVAITGDLRKCDCVLLTVQHLHYTSGSLV